MTSEKPEISRVNRSREDARTSYNKMSKWYDTIAKPEKKYIEIGLKNLAVKEGENVLEIGFGTGDALINLSQSVGDSGKVYGIDISEGMLEVTKSKLEKEGLLERTRLVLGDAFKLPFDDEFFDVLFMSFTLELFDTPEIPELLAECKRVLKIGGRIGVVAISEKDVDNVMTKLYKWAHMKFPSYVDCRPIYTKQELEKSGFTIMRLDDFSMWELPVDVVVAKK
ncbi:MAG: 2-heptaprenyl-1,4-naphthoquinone methyltransferase [Methanobacterium sp. BRmetb2]|nr:MAG: 2-heptaprenyl-1,4-naphthoquinone methyltransferase [Methanobacterium sp. BRmetb2]